MFTPDNIFTRRKTKRLLMIWQILHIMHNISLTISVAQSLGYEVQEFIFIELCLVKNKKVTHFPTQVKLKKGTANWMMRKESSVNTPLVVRKILNHEKCCRIFEILTPEQRIVWQASGSAWRAPPTLAEVWSLEERVFLKVHITVSHCTHATWRQCWQTHRSCI